MGNRTNAFMAFVAGAAAGAVAGLLLAPSSGEETRERLGKDFDEYSEKAKKAAKEQYKEAADKMEDLKNTTIKYVEDKIKSKT